MLQYFGNTGAEAFRYLIQTRRIKKMATAPPTAAPAADRPQRTVEQLIAFAGDLANQSDALLHRAWELRDRLRGAKPRDEVATLGKEPIEEVRAELDDLRWKLEMIAGNLAQTESTMTDLEQI